MAINKINVDGVEHELAGSGGGGFDLVCVIDATEWYVSNNTDYSCFLNVTWFHDNITWDNISNMRIIFKSETINYNGYTTIVWTIQYDKNNGEITLYLYDMSGTGVRITMTSDFTITNAEKNI